MIDITKLLKEREKYQSLLKQELVKPKQQQKQELINYYEARQVTAKLLANAGYAVFARKEFEYSDYRVSEIITGFGRLTHKKMQELGLNYGFQTVFGLQIQFLLDIINKSLHLTARGRIKQKRKLINT